MSRVLILDCESAAGVESIQSLGRQGVTVHASSRSSDALGFKSRYVAAKFAQPTEPNMFVSWIAALDERHDYALIVAATEVSLSALNAAELSELLRQKAVLPSRESLTLALNKEQTWNLAQRLGIPVPLSVQHAERDGGMTLPFPVVVKPVNSKRIAQQEVQEFPVSIVRDATQWKQVLMQSRGMPFQVQEYVHGRGIGIELLFEHGEPRWHFAHERIHEYPLTGGGSSYRRSICPDAKLLDASRMLLRELNWHGVAMIEWKMNDRGEWYLIEINPRLWGSLALAIDAGVNFPAGLFALAVGSRLPPQPRFRVPYFARNIARDVTWQVANLRADHADPLLFTRSRLSSFAELLRPLLWRESWDHFDFRDFGVMREIWRRLLSLRISSVTVSAVRRWRGLSLGRRQSRVLRRVARRGNVKNILFVCYGNICRSPFAQYLLRKKVTGFEVISGGFIEKEGRCSPQKMVHAGLMAQIDLSAHRSRALTAEMIVAADLVVLMDWRNYELMEQSFPEALGKTVFLGLFCDPKRAEIADPYDLSEKDLGWVTEQIKSGVENLARWLRKQ